MTSQLETRNNTNITFTQLENGKFSLNSLPKRMGVLYCNMNKCKLVLYRYLLKIEGCELGGGGPHIPVNRAFLFKFMPFINILFSAVKGA
jgi:hypothetical protein